jgi:phage shock protein E
MKCAYRLPDFFGLVVIATLLVACAAEDQTGKEAYAAVEAGALLIDVRSPEEFATGHLPGALNIPHGEIVDGVARLQVSKDAPIVLYCRSGNRSGIAKTALESAGYDDLMNAGGFAALAPVWDAKPAPAEKPAG